MNNSFFHCLFACLVLAFAAPAFAADNQSLQDTLNTPTPEQQRQQQNAPNPYEDLPEEYIQEANQFFVTCDQTSTMYLYYDCKCLATAYLDKRIELGPNPPPSKISLSIENTCIDATGAAGYVYDQCFSLGSMMPTNRPIEEYCTCYANTYSKLFQEVQTAPSSQVFMQLQTQAHLMCQDPALADKLYPKKKQAN
jgi:hypothetical protein